MFGSRVILMASEKHPLAEAFSDAQMVCAANYQVPLFWLLAFSQDDLAFFQSENAPAYPVLVCERGQALKRLRERLPQLEQKLTVQELALLTRWIAYLADLSFSFLTIDTYELWKQQQSPDDLQQQLTGELQQIAELDLESERVIEQWQAAGRWQQNNTLSLCGYGW